MAAGKRRCRPAATTAVAFSGSASVTCSPIAPRRSPQRRSEVNEASSADSGRNGFSPRPQHSRSLSPNANAGRLLSWLALLAVVACRIHRHPPNVLPVVDAFLPRHHSSSSVAARRLHMVSASPSFSERDMSSWGRSRRINLRRDGVANRPSNRKKKYRRKNGIPETEMETRRLKKERQAKYEQLMSSADGDVPNLWSFESLFPEPVLDEQSIQFDLYEIKRRDAELDEKRQQLQQQSQPTSPNIDNMDDNLRTTGRVAGSDASPASFQPRPEQQASSVMQYADDRTVQPYAPPRKASGNTVSDVVVGRSPNVTAASSQSAQAIAEANDSVGTNSSGKVNRELTKLVEDRIYGYRTGSSTYETSLMGDGAIKFRDGVRLGNALPVNAARLNYFAKKELRRDRVEEAQELLEKAVAMDPRNGRAYLGLSRAAQRRRDFKLARYWLKTGIANSVSFDDNGERDRGANPFLLQALGVLEEKTGNLAQAEALYFETIKSRPSHAAGWVALAQLRTRKFRQGAAAGRVCYESASRELELAGKPQSAHVFTAWASMEYKKANDVRRARELYRKALEIDPRCSAAWLQLGVMEAAVENWNDAQECFDTVLEFDKRNSRVLQAYAIMESKRPDSDSRKAIGLFEKALQANRRDAGVLQAYGLYVAKLGDIESARSLLQRATAVNKRHSAAWQAWGVLESRYGDANEARTVFQQGIWACAQPSGGQSGGYGCARLWQAWGVLEAQEGDNAAARRCFSRALDADNRNVAAVTAWTQMEERLGNVKDAALIYERFLRQFAAGTQEKMALWKSYERMLQRADEKQAASDVYQRSIRETFSIRDEQQQQQQKTDELVPVSSSTAAKRRDGSRTASAARRVEDEDEDSGQEVWMNDGSIEGKVPEAFMKKAKSKKRLS